MVAKNLLWMEEAIVARLCDYDNIVPRARGSSVASMGQNWIFYCLVTADFWLFGSNFGCLVITAAKPFLKLIRGCQ
jgi:hypothetical protein